MAFRNTNSAETWEKVYEAFSEVNFSSFDFDSIKASILDYMKIYYSEVFNDFIQSSELIMIIDSFCYVAEQLAYRIDMVAHENFISTAQRKQSILRLAKLISYQPTRNIPVRGLVKFTSISTSERVIDGRGVDLSGVSINWNDPNNPNWKEQFFLVMNKILSTRFGVPQKTFQVNDVVMDLYSLVRTNSFVNNVFSYNASTGLNNYPMEIVPSDIDSDGPFEREPDLNSSMSIIYANDGVGDNSDFSGFLAFTKQGVLSRIDYNIKDSLPNRKLEFLPDNVNHTDVWVQKINTQNNAIAERWKQVETVSEQNLIFNDDRSTRKKYEVNTLENDQIAIIFGDGDFADIPTGQFRFWMRQSANASIVIPKNKIVNQLMSFSYVSEQGNTETCSLTFSLTGTLQNGSASESIEHIRRSAPATYYAQNRMVNAQDYNTYLLKDPSILRLKTINRTFAGQPKYIDWNDASGAYENVKLFGDDLELKYDLSLQSATSAVSGQALIDSIIEPILNTPDMLQTMISISAAHPATKGVVSSPRRTFIEDNRAGRYYKDASSFVNLYSGVISDGSLKEKTMMQGLIDRHWYGEPVEYVEGPNSQIYAKILDPILYPQDDTKIYASNVPRTIDGINKYPPGDIGSGLQALADQDYFALTFKRTLLGIGNGNIGPCSTELIINKPAGTDVGEVFTIEFLSDQKTFTVKSSLKGSFPTGTVDEDYQININNISTNFFKITEGTSKFAHGDAFIIDIGNTAAIRNIAPFFNTQNVINLNGYFEFSSAAQLGQEFANAPQSVSPYFHNLSFNPLSEDKKQNWVLFIRKLRQQPSNAVIGYEIYHRKTALVCYSQNTKFWYNDGSQLLDSETKKVVFDRIKILRSNLKNDGAVLGKTHVYDVISAVKNNVGELDTNKLVLMPSDMLQEDSSGNLESDRLLQFELFAGRQTTSYEYFALSNPNIALTSTALQSAVSAFSTSLESDLVDPSLTYGRRLKANNMGEGLDFMWQHFAPHTNIIDPSPTNIHDAYVITQGYYDSMKSYLRRTSNIAPTAPTPLELRNSYSYLLKNKMLSDTVVLHSGKIKLLFGSLAEAQLRAKFKVVKSSTSSLTNEQIKEEVLSAINTYFDISNWDFGEQFYATDLTSLIHQRLPSDINSVVLVPIYSTNSFGDLFTVNCGDDEILQSSAELSDIEVVEALTSTVLRQVK